MISLKIIILMFIEFMLKGWIACNKDDKILLEGFGIKLSEYGEGEFTNCIVPKKALKKLQPY